MEEIRIIPLPLPFRLGSVNCYLVRTAAGFVLVDTGASGGRAALEAELARAGCRPGDLTLIALTHGDFDHTGNAAHLRAMFGAPLAMHRDDAGMAERGDMFWNRRAANALLRRLAPILFRFPPASRFTPDLTLGEGDSLSAYGWDARALSLPGHSRGSLGILTAGGALFCGDLLDNSRQPAVNAIMDDAAAGEASLARLRGLEIETVYPGHGRPFAGADLPTCRPADLPAGGRRRAISARPGTQGGGHENAGRL
jgi:glyoxylase-like metal-dependent hydrolase (beta-lactamase superfamily II)